MRESADRIDRAIADEIARKPGLQEAYERDVALQRAINARKEAGEPIPVSWIKNPYYLRYYAHLGELLDDAGSPVPPPATPSAEGAS